MKIDCSYDALVEVEKLVPHPQNPNKHPDKQIERLSKIIEYQGQRSAIVVSKRTGFIIVGHGRLQAIKKLGWEKVAVNYQEFENDAQEYAHMTADNAIAEWAELDLSQINMDFLDLGPDLDIEMLGIENFSIEPVEKFEAKTDEDDVPEVNHPITRKGDIWLLGNHRLMCGDSTMIDDVEKLMNGERADISFTSPPYNVGVSIDNNGKKKMYVNCDDNNANYSKFLIDFNSIIMGFCRYSFVNIQGLSKNMKDLFVFNSYFLENLKDVLIWNKKNCPPNIQKGSFNTKFEYVFAYSSEIENGRNFPCSWQGKFPNVIDCETNLNNQETETHRAGFPVSFPLWIIEKMDFSKSVIDPFMGTGTTLIACEKANRRCYGMEIDEKYCDVIINRYMNYTGRNDVTLESTGQTYEELKVERDGEKE